MLVLNTQQETTLLAVLEGNISPEVITAANGIYQTLVGRRAYRLGIEQAEENAAMRKFGPPGSQDRI